VIGTSRQVRAFAYGSPVDMRKGFDGLHALVRRELGRDPLSGDLYLFVNRSRKRAKVLLWDGTGLCIYAKRLEKGVFACLWRAGDGAALDLSVTELQLFLEGSALVGRVALSPAPLSFENPKTSPLLQANQY
jgi:transposase